MSNCLKCSNFGSCDKSFINEEYKECLDACYSSLFLIKNLKLED